MPAPVLLGATLPQQEQIVSLLPTDSLLTSILIMN